MQYLQLILALILLTAFGGRAEASAPVKPAAADKCPVCGMFVAKYPDFAARIVFQDGTYVFFDGVKDMMKYLFLLEKYNPSKKVSDVATISVTDYYTLQPIDGANAHYVVGSDVYGPMGRELIPFKEEADAREFLKDHKGKSVVQFKEINRELIATLD